MDASASWQPIAFLHTLVGSMRQPTTRSKTEHYVVTQCGASAYHPMPVSPRAHRCQWQLHYITCNSKAAQTAIRLQWREWHEHLVCFYLVALKRAIGWRRSINHRIHRGFGPVSSKHRLHPWRWLFFSSRAQCRWQHHGLHSQGRLWERHEFPHKWDQRSA